MDPQFVHLRLHTEFSLHDGILTIPGLVDRAKAFNMPALGISDISNLYATIKFYQAAQGAGIKPIIGTDLTLINPDKPSELSRFTLICQTHEGYRNLLQLISKAYLEGQTHGSPTLRWEWLCTHSDGLIALSGAQYGNIGLALLSQNQAAAHSLLEAWKAIFGDRFYLEVSRVGKPEEASYLPAIIDLAAKTQTPVVATNDVRFLDPDDFDAHEARVCIQEGLTLTDPARPRQYTREQYFCSAEAMVKRFSDLPSALQNSVEIAKRCNVKFTLGKNTLPHFPVPPGDTTESHLEKVATTGLMDRLNTLYANQPDERLSKQPAYEARLKRELDVINTMGFAGYFLIVADFTQWAKENDIPVGPGRGSGPGSLVAYALKITDLDPIALELLFERFLNPERVSMPDFDIDFCMEGRDKVIDYVMHKHGHDHVSQIITYGTMAAKAVVRDVGRVLALGYGFVDKLAKLIPFELGITLEKALEQEPVLRERYEQEEEVKTLIDLALKLEGITRNVGKHAGGIVIAPGKLTDFVPLYCEPGESAHPVTQFDKDDVEAAGLVKFDFLGLKTLTVIDRALKRIHENKNRDKVDISLIPLDDAATFDLLKKCKSTAVFQLESHGMRDLIKRLQPDCFEDMIALVALFRPGPLQSGMVDDFINRKHGRARVVYPHPDLEPILRPTYGVILYQEQVMQIAQVLASYTLGAADILRRAMGKKKPEEMAKQREIFTKGAVARGVKEETATSIFDLMEKFAGYGFNKSHSASYALIAYQTAWLKAHYPAEFMAAVLSSDMDKTDKIVVFLAECEAMKLRMLPPDVNHSDFFFKVIDHEELRYGLGAIKGMGEAAIENIVQTRQKNGAYRDLFDFCARVDLKKINKRALEALIKSGALDCLGKNRATLLASLPNALQQAEQALHNQTYGQHDLLALAQDTETSTPHYVECDPWTDDLQLQGEKETLGFYLTGHPLNRYLNEIRHFTSGRLIDIHPSSHTNATVAGMITNVRTRVTKRGDRMAIFTLDDGTATMEMVCFSEPYLKFRNIIIEDQVIIVTGDVGHDDFNNSAKMTVRDIQTLEQARMRHAKSVLLTIPEETHFDPLMLKHLLQPHCGGSCPMIIRLIKAGIATNVRLGSSWLIQPTDALITSIKATFTLGHIEVVY